jgi:uncharacterized protein YcbK (DUF882 family)
MDRVGGGGEWSRLEVRASARVRSPSVRIQGRTVAIGNLQAPLDAGRRELLRGGAALAVGLLLGAPIGLRGFVNARAAKPATPPGLPGGPRAAPAADAPEGFLAARLPRSLSLFNTHTNETIETVYWCDDAYCAPGLKEIDHLLRDHRTGEVKEIDRSLLNLLHDLRSEAGVNQPFHVISGYRSPASNALLRQEGHGVAARSFHMQGRAIDIRLPGIDLTRLRDTAVRLGRGGVGYYPASNFVHVDVGPLRTW